MGSLSEMKNLIKEKNKIDLLVRLFEENDHLPIATVLRSTGIKTEHALRTYLSLLRKTNRLFLRQKFGYIEREPIAKRND